MPFCRSNHVMLSFFQDSSKTAILLKLFFEIEKCNVKQLNLKLSTSLNEEKKGNIEFI